MPTDPIRSGVPANAKWSGVWADRWAGELRDTLCRVDLWSFVCRSDLWWGQHLWWSLLHSGRLPNDEWEHVWGVVWSIHLCWCSRLRWDKHRADLRQHLWDDLWHELLHDGLCLMSTALLTSPLF